LGFRFPPGWLVLALPRSLQLDRFPNLRLSLLRIALASVIPICRRKDPLEFRVADPHDVVVVSFAYVSKLNVPVIIEAEIEHAIGHSR
jgi:hypothetical protein